MHAMIRLVPWDDVLYEEGLSATQLRRLIDQGLYSPGHCRARERAHF